MSNYKFTTTDIFGNYLTFDGGTNVGCFSLLISCVVFLAIMFGVISVLNFVCDFLNNLFFS